MTKEIDRIAESAYQDFSNAADYLWKTPRFIEKEFKDELKKLPDDEEIARLRWRHESTKLKPELRKGIRKTNNIVIASRRRSNLLVDEIALSLRSSQ